MPSMQAITWVSVFIGIAVVLFLQWMLKNTWLSLFSGLLAGILTAANLLGGI